MKDKLYIALAIDRIVRKTGWGPVDSWSSEKYAQLSEEIRKITGNNISESTLRRLFRKKRTPAEFGDARFRTRNILASYLGYPSWEQFKRENQLNKEQFDEETELESQYESSGNRQTWLTAAIVLFAMLAIYLLLREFHLV